MPLLAKQLGRDFFTEKLSSICVGWLGDDIASIRAAAANTMAELTKLFGTDWACEYLIPSVDDIRLHPSYLRRLTAVQACSKMAMEMDPAMASIEILPIILEMATDTVPNIRFNVAKELGKLSKVFDQNIFDQQIYPILTLLMDDPDRDVQFFAKKASKRTE
jgi:serine/threonine-protein phosphatase 2A regulatory subunit A